MTVEKPYVGCWSCGHHFDPETDPFFPYPADRNVFCPKCRAPWVLTAPENDQTPWQGNPVEAVLPEPGEPDG